MIIILLCLLSACLYKTTFIKGKGCFYEKPLQLDNIIPLRGILALEIVLGHTYGHLEDNAWLYLNNRIGVWVVGIFFFLSGYGLNYSLHRKRDYLKGFLIKRVGRIILPFAVVCVANYFLGYSGGFPECLFQDWFVTEIILIYCIWYLLYKYLPESYAEKVFLVLILGLNILGTYYGIGSRWYGSTACFLLGIIFEKKESAIFSYCSTRYGKMVGICGGLFVCGGILFAVSENSPAAAAVMINTTCILLCIMMYLFLMKAAIGNAMTRFLGSISWQIYVSHRTILRVCDQVQAANDFLYVSLLFAGVVVVSYGLGLLEK